MAQPHRTLPPPTYIMCHEYMCNARTSCSIYLGFVHRDIIIEAGGYIESSPAKIRVVVDLTVVCDFVCAGRYTCKKHC